MNAFNYKRTTTKKKDGLKPGSRCSQHDTLYFGVKIISGGMFVGGNCIGREYRIVYFETLFKHSLSAIIPSALWICGGFIQQ